MSVAVWAMSGVCSLVSSVPLPVMKFSRAGIGSRSDGTFGLSRVKWVLSKTTFTTCCTPFPRVQLLAADWLGAVFAAVAAGTATCQPKATGAPTKNLISRLIPFPLCRNPPKDFARNTTVVGARYPEVITGLELSHPPSPCRGAINRSHPYRRLRAGLGRGARKNPDIDSRYIGMIYLYAI